MKADDTLRRLMDAEAEAARPEPGTLLGLRGAARHALMLVLVLLLVVCCMAVTRCEFAAPAFAC